jgi:RNA polymerase sigma-70 factor (ECF subfamily)
MAPDPDAALMVAFQGGDEAAFRALFEKHGRATMAFCQRFVKDAARAEELAQDVFLKLHTGADRYQPSARFTTFLYRIATNHCLNEVRRGEYHAHPEIDPDSVEFPQGMNVTIGTTARNDREAMRLLALMGVPFRTN